MINKLKKAILNVIKGEKDVPLLAGFVSGFYPFLFYFSNNFTATNSIEHLITFLILFLIVPVLLAKALYSFFDKSKVLSKYKENILFVFIIVTTITLLFIFSTMNIRFSFKKRLFLIFVYGVFTIGTILLSKKYSKIYKKLIALIFVISILPFSSLSLKFYEHLRGVKWMVQPDNIKEIKFVDKPNIYLIQPDGYVNEMIMNKKPYSYENDMYNWLQERGFKLYENFRSNYPATLISNSSMFGMKQHFYGDMLFPSIEMTHARRIVSGDNDAIEILKKNGYKTFSIVSDEYFQQNNSKSLYNYSNISLNEIPLFSTGDMVKKDVFTDLKSILDKKVESPSFYFIEKLEPQHIGIQFVDDKLKEERDYYIARVQKANSFLKKTISYIEKKDPSGIIIVLADHGGFVGIENYYQMYSNDNKDIVNSTFSVLFAIKWNGFLKEKYDENLKTNVNLFRVLFSALSENPKYLQHLEDDSSYNLNYENPFYNSVYKVIDDKGNMLLKPLKTK